MRKVPKNFKCNLSVKTKNKLGLKIGVEEIEEDELGSQFLDLKPSDFDF